MGVAVDLESLRVTLISNYMNIFYKWPKLYDQTLDTKISVPADFGMNLGCFWANFGANFESISESIFD
jgi:hypothetical protein